MCIFMNCLEKSYQIIHGKSIPVDLQGFIWGEGVKLPPRFPSLPQGKEKEREKKRSRERERGERKRWGSVYY